MLRHCLFYFIKRILSFRYQIEIRGLDTIKRAAFHNEGGILFLPNHPAEIDPILLYLILERKFSPRPLIVEHFYYMKGVSWVMRWIRALPIPFLEAAGNKWKAKQIQAALETVKEGLIAGENFLIYPSGHLKKEGFETVAGHSFTHSILEVLPTTRVVLVRTTGLWGSRFSRARVKNTPDFWKEMVRSIRVLVMNAFVFCPKRRVVIEFEAAPKDFPYRKTKRELNAYLERWYNQYPMADGRRVPEEPLTLVPYRRGQGGELIRQPLPKKKKHFEPVDLSEEEKNVIAEKIKDLAECSLSEVTEDKELSADLGLDSLDIAELYTFLDERYDLQEGGMEDLVTVYDVFDMAYGLKKQTRRKGAIIGNRWPREKRRRAIEVPKGKTLPEVFFRAAALAPKSIVCADANVKPMRYRKVLLTAIALSLPMRELKGKYVAVLLPASVATFLIILALLLAKKIPVMLNWTLGVRALNHAKDLLNLKTVLSARKFLSQVDKLDLGLLEPDLLLAEDLKKRVTIIDRLKALGLSRLPQRLRLAAMGLRSIKTSDTAAILFTSGTEAYPKAVPLSHENVLEDQRGALACVRFLPDEIMYGILPPFHSFGFTVTGLLPLLSGMRVFYAPDPTDNHAMTRDVIEQQITLFCCAPTFFRNLFRVADPGELKSVRLFVTGAEKAGDDLFQLAKDVGGQMIEGYGITECSPIVTLCRPGAPRIGVGQPIAGVEIMTLDPETHVPLPQGEVGEIAIKGKNVFSGYIGTSAPFPFVEIGKERWYVSGDLGRVDPQGNLILEGRLKRFVKIGGEMVSLPALEEEILKVAKQKGWEPLPIERPALTVIPSEKDKDRPKLVLFSVFEAPKEEINAALSEAGFGRIVKIHDCVTLDEIPLTGPGKVSLGKLKEFLP